MTGWLLLRPIWLAAFPALGLVALLIWRRRPDADGWEQVIDPPMLAGLRNLGLLRVGDHRRRQWLALAAAAFLAAGLAGPAQPRRDAPVFAQTDAIVMAIDMSPSVANGPALSDAQAAAAAVLAASAGRPVGLVLFAGEAYEVAAPTSDPATLESQIAVLDGQTMPTRGSRPAAALGLAGQMLAGLKRADLVLISDGGGVDQATRAEAARLAALGVRLSVLTLDRPAEGAPPPDLGAMENLAEGRFAPARNPDRVLTTLGAGGSLSPEPGLNALQYRDLGPLLAAFAAFPLLLLFRRWS